MDGRPQGARERWLPVAQTCGWAQHPQKAADRAGFEAIAEGVESEKQALVLDELGYGQLQGYLFSTPAPMAEVVRELETFPLAPLPAADSGRSR